MFLEEITGDVRLEDKQFECKARLNRDDVIGWLKTVAGFANAFGGDIFLGVEDGTNKLIGFERTEADRERNYFNNQINEHLFPRPQMNIRFLRYEVRNSERFIIHVRVADSPVKPIVMKFDGVPSIYMRRDGFTNGATYEEIISMSVKSSRKQYDVQVSDEVYREEEFSELREFFSAHTGGKKLSDKWLRSIGFYDENGRLANGAVLFSDTYEGNKTEVRCHLYSGLTRGDDRIVTVNQEQGNLTHIIGYINDFVLQRMNHSMIKKNDSRVNVDAYPARALFEGIVNAVAHRDYYLDGTQIQVDMFRDRLEISSPGGFYLGEKLGKTYDLSGVISKRRNELITAVLVKCNVMEAAGTGFEKIMEDYKDVDDAHRPYICSSTDHFTLVLPDLTYASGVTEKMTPEIVFAPVPNGTVHDEKVLSFCYYQAHKVSEIAEFLGVSDSTFLRKKVLENLHNNGYLDWSKESRASYYRTNRELVNLE